MKMSFMTYFYPSIPHSLPFVISSFFLDLSIRAELVFLDSVGLAWKIAAWNIQARAWLVWVNGLPFSTQHKKHYYFFKRKFLNNFELGLASKLYTWSINLILSRFRKKYWDIF